MQYKKMNGEYYVRLDPNEELIVTLKKICAEEKIYGGHFQGIGACGKVVLSTYLPKVNEFKEHEYIGMLEMASLMGNDYIGEIILRPSQIEITQREDIVPKAAVWNL